jgi:aminoglycoside phosphotransferase
MAEAGLLEELRAVDWRFLLPRPTPQRVLLLERRATGWGDAVVRGLRAAGAEVTRVGSESARGQGADLVIASEPDAIAAALRFPAATLVAAAPGSPAARLASDRAVRRAVGSGRRLLRVAAWPPLAAPTELVPIVGGDAGDYLRRRRTGPAGRTAARLMPIVGRTVLPLLPSVSIASAGPVAPAEALLRLIDEPVRHWLLLTPRFAASRHVVLLAGAARSSPSRVAKVARLPGDRSVARETAVLAAAHRRGGSATLPGLIAETELAGHPTLVESWVEGEPLDPRRLRSNPAAYSERIVAWLRSLVGEAAPLDGARWQCLVEAPLERLARLAEATDFVDAPLLVARTRTALAGLRGMTLPVALEHGDLAHPNLLATAGGGIGVIDWELGVPDGFPLRDLVFFLSWVAASVEGAGSAAEHASAATGAVMSGSSAWQRSLLLREAERIGVDGALVDRLIVLCWLAQLVRPLGEEAGARPDRELARRAWGHRHRLLLEAALEHARG